MKWYGNSPYRPALGRDKEYESTLTNMYEFITHDRRDGNSTRLVDNAIQILYDDKVCLVRDHHEMGSNRQANQYLMDMILRRLSSEHNLAALIAEDRIRIDHNKLEIEFKPDPKYLAYIRVVKKQLDNAIEQIGRIPSLIEHSELTYKEWMAKQKLFRFSDIL